MDLLDQAQQKNNEPQSTDIPDLSSLMHPEIDKPLTETSAVPSVSSLPVTDVPSNTTTSSFSANPTSFNPQINNDANPPSDPPPSPPTPNESPKPPLHRSRGVLIAAIALFLLTLPVIGFFASNSSQLADLRGRAAGGSCQGTPPPGCTVSGFAIGGCGGRSQSNCNAVSACGCSWVEDIQPTQPPVQPTSGTQPTSPPANTCAVTGSAPGCEGKPFGWEGDYQGTCIRCFDNDPSGNRCGRDFCGTTTQCTTGCYDVTTQNPTCNSRNLNAGSGACTAGKICCAGSIGTTPAPTGTSPSRTPTPTPRPAFYCDGEIAAMCQENGLSCIPSTTGGRCSEPTGTQCTWRCLNDCATSAVASTFNNTWCNGQAQWLYESAISQGLSGSTCGGSPSTRRNASTACPGPTPTVNPLTVCSNSSDSTCGGRSFQAACTLTGGGSGSCSASSITGSDGKRICSCASLTPGPTSPLGGPPCTTVGDRTCINGKVHICTQIAPGVREYGATSENCSITCGSLSDTACSGKTIASACNYQGTNDGFCQSQGNDPVTGVHACACTPPRLNSPTPTRTSGGNPTPTGGVITQCQNGAQDRDQNNWLICECNNGCSLFTDSSQGGGGTGWVCNENCRVVPRGTMPQTTCSQIDYVHQGTSNYCGVHQINCPTSCQTGGSTPNNTPVPPTNTPNLAQCQNIKIYRGGTLLLSTQYNSIKPGDQLVLATVATGTTTKARYTINNGTPQETTLKNNQGEYILNYTIPVVTVATQFRIQAEIFADNVWK